VFIGVAKEKAQAFQGKKINGQFEFTRDKTVYANLCYFYSNLRKIGREINRRLLEVERVSHNNGLSGDSIQRVVQPTVTEDGEKAPSLKFGQPKFSAPDRRIPQP